MRLLLLSNSTNPGEAYLDYPKHAIKDFLGEKPVKVLFIPYAAVTFSFDEYEAKVSARFQEIGHQIVSIHHFKDPAKAIEEAEAIAIGGGNTWKLVRLLQEYDLMSPIRDKVMDGTPYIGWSAGSNVACPTMRTTNDMPIIQPYSFDTLSLIPFQINPHFTDFHPAGHGGETREDRIMEFLELDPDMYVVGLREGTMLRREEDKLQLIGEKTARIFKQRRKPEELSSDHDLSFLLEA